MSAFVIALQFLTRIPIRQASEWQGPVMGRAVLYYPLVGLFIGVILALLFNLLAQQSLLLSAALLLAVWVFITGGLHLDGLADSADAWAGGLGDTKRTLEIMKDPRAGALAIVVLVMVLLIKLAAIVAALEMNQWHGILIAPVLGRSVVVLLFLTTSYVREEGLGSDMARYLPRKRSILVLLITACCLVYLLDFWMAIILLVSTIIMFSLLRQMMIKRIGGMTGDTAGALIELVEVFVLVFITQY